MKNIFTLFKKASPKTRQQILLDFVNDADNIEKAVQGSMEKRIELIDLVSQKQLA